MSGMSGIGVCWAFTSLIASLSVCIGFFMPYWLTGSMTLPSRQSTGSETPVHFGVFRRCNYPAIRNDGTWRMVLECGRYRTFSDIPSISWQIATLTLGVGCILTMLVALIAMFGVCVRGVVIPTVARTAGIIQLCSGILMGAGIGVYPNGLDSREVQQACHYTTKAYTLGDCSLSWCFYVTSAGVGVTLVCAALAFHAPKRKQYVSGYAL